jgi:protein TonB
MDVQWSKVATLGNNQVSAGSGADARAPPLDTEALDVLSRASPLPPPPNDMGGATVELALPIQFKVKR